MSRLIRGVIFDLDGTLVDSGLDFDLMRCEMGLPAGLPILEALSQLPECEAARCHEILHRHEREGAERAQLMPGVREFVQELARRGIRQAVLTRNSRETAQATLGRLGLTFGTLIAREDAPAKPDPTGIWKICASWGLDRKSIVMIGDFYLDIEAGHRAGVWTVLYTGGREPAQVRGAEQADCHLRCFREHEALLAWLGGDVRT